MKAEREPQGGLAEAQHNIAVLLDELEDTLELVQRLSESGEPDAAVRLIDHQRTELYRVVDSISHGVGRKRTLGESLRRNVAAFAAAAVLIVSSLAASVAALNRTDPAQETRAQLDRAASVTDEVERLTILIRVYETTRLLAQDVEVKSDLADALTKAIDDVTEGDTPSNGTLIKQAEQAVEDLKEGSPPEPPSAPGNGQGPVETLQGLLDPDP